ncbi:MAG TPA: hypothetical protein VM888_13575 [Chitinophagaceae bacterium]|nr:hypothetical protein [Chitinophagaceae bacterium]
MSVVLGVVLLSLIPLYNGTISKYISDENLRTRVEAYEKSNFNADTREIVYSDFFIDFKKNNDWVFGRGLLGTTFSEEFIIIQLIEGFEQDVFGFPLGYRTEIECGYLMYILKVGIVGLVLLLIISLRAIFLGLVHSDNYFVKACAFIIIEWLISMYPYAIPEYHPSYILFWLSIGACLSKKMRSLNNLEIKKLVFAN